MRAISPIARLIFILSVILFILPLFFDYYLLGAFIPLALLSLSLGLIWGYGNILCFGQAAFFGLGAYVFAIAGINFGNPWIALFIGIIITGFCAFLLGLILFYGQLDDVYLAVVTLVFSLILFKFFNATAGSNWIIGKAHLGGFNGIPNFPTLYVPGHPDQWLIDGPFYIF
ncbi:MAG: branched-chain amino acid ABC transporter permease, partial [Pseudomonadota bacterium]